MPGYRLFGHTSEVGFTAWGDSLAQAFEEAARALVAVTYDPRTIRLRETREVAVEGDRPDRLLVRFLGEMVYLIDAEGFVPARARVEMTEGGLTARLRGRVADSFRPTRRGPHVKAVTYHGLEIDPGPPVKARVVLDI
jgi:SHS2 domain-containing protein